jgi:hypothetical protein
MPFLPKPLKKIFSYIQSAKIQLNSFGINKTWPKFVAIFVAFCRFLFGNRPQIDPKQPRAASATGGDFVRNTVALSRPRPEYKSAE